MHRVGKKKHILVINCSNIDDPNLVLKIKIN